MQRWRIVGIGIGLLGLLAAACAAPAFDSARAWADLKQQVAFGYRIPGTEPHKATRDWLAAQLAPSAKSVTLQPFTHVFNRRTVTMWNIIADIPGNGRTPREKVLLCAHWDSRPTADKDPNPALRRRPIPGANDGASGVAVLLEVARQLKARPVARDVQIVFFDGEDYGPNVDNMLLGSAYFAAHLTSPKPAWGILLDMIGDADLGIYREPISDRYAAVVNDRVFIAAEQLGYLCSGRQVGFINQPYRNEVTDDHVALIKAGVPTVDLIDFDYPYWHTTQDTPARCSPDSLAIVGRTLLQTLRNF